MHSRKHDFFEMMRALKDSLATDYHRIRARTKDDPGTAGDQAEEDWAAILRDWLPAIYPVFTKGRILFEDGSSSPQVDVLVLKPSYPQGLRHQKYFFAGGVIICVADAATLPLTKHVLIGRNLDEHEIQALEEAGGSDLISTMYVIHDEHKMELDSTGAILAGLIHELTYRMAFEDASIRDRADNLSYIGSYGGIGRPVYWTSDDLSTQVKRRLNDFGGETDQWSKWCRFLP